MRLVLSVFGLVVGGGVFAISLSIGGPAYHFPLAAGFLAIVTSLVVATGTMRLRNTANGAQADKMQFPLNAALVTVATILLPIALTMRISFGPVAFLFLWIAIIALHPDKKRGVLMGLPIAVVVGFGVTAIFRELLQVDLP